MTEPTFPQGLAARTTMQPKELFLTPSAEPVAHARGTIQFEDLSDPLVLALRLGERKDALSGKLYAFLPHSAQVDLNRFVSNPKFGVSEEFAPAAVEAMNRLIQIETPQGLAKLTGKSLPPDVTAIIKQDSSSRKRLEVSAGIIMGAYGDAFTATELNDSTSVFTSVSKPTYILAATYATLRQRSQSGPGGITSLGKQASVMVAMVPVIKGKYHVNDVRAQLVASNLWSSLFDAHKVYGTDISLQDAQHALDGQEATFCDTTPESAHILPFSGFHNDDPRNGIALCPNHHKGFDRGWFGLSEDHTVIVSTCLEYRERYVSPGTKLLAPADPAVMPAIEALRWHRNNGFLTC